MATKACIWIRDGVLINRMHVNAVAFAACYWLFVEPGQRSNTSLEELISFGFEKSGYSCLEKMQFFNLEKIDLLKEAEAAAAFYNKLAQSAGSKCQFFNFAPELLSRLSSEGVKNYITSAIEQEVLDQWSASAQGLVVNDSLTEILGKRENFVKGPDHFKYISDRVGGGSLYYVADAVSEILIASRYAEQYNISCVGFAYHINHKAVEEAFEIVKTALSDFLNISDLPYGSDLSHPHFSKVNLPDQMQTVESLRNAGAKVVVTGNAENIMANLAVKLNSMSVY